MRLIALHDGRGLIRAAVAHNGDYDGPLPVAADGHDVIEFELPDELAERPLDEICLRMRIDLESGRLIDLEPSAE